MDSTGRATVSAANSTEHGAAGTASAAAQAIDAVKVYGTGQTRVQALDHVNVAFAEGQFTAIMGRSGSGKSTLMHCLAGLDTLTSGRILIGDTELGSLDDKHLTQLRRDRVGFVFQSFNLVPTLTAAENIALPAALAGRSLGPALGGHRHRRGRPAGSAPVPAGRAVRRAAAAGGGGSGSGVGTGDRLRRRADRQPRLPGQRRDPVLSAPSRSREFGQTIVMVTHDPAAARATPTGWCSSPTAASSTRWPQPTRREGPRPYEEPGVEGHVESDAGQPAGPPAAPDPDRPVHRARRGVRDRDAHLHRHLAQHVRPALQRRLRQDQRAGARAVSGHRPVRRQVLHPDAGVDPAAGGQTCPGWRRRRARCPASPSSSTSTTRPSPRTAPRRSAPVTARCRRSPASPLPPGSAPLGPDQVVIDKGTADKYGFKVGDPIEILFQGPPERFTVVGIVKFGKANGLGGATVAEFDLPVAQQLLNRVGTFDAVNLLATPGCVADHAANDGLQAPAVGLPGRHRVPSWPRRTPTRSTRASRSSPTSCWSSPWCRCSSGSFIILNTFSILVAQRTRELALFRALGASRKQVLLATLVEAGRGRSGRSSRRGRSSAPCWRPAWRPCSRRSAPASRRTGLVFKPRTAVVGLVVGVGVSLLASLNPARRAARVPPVAALGATVAEPQHSPVRRTIIGTIGLVIGVAVMMLGLFVASHQAAQVGIGIAVTFLGVATLAPFVARPVTGLLGRPLRRVSGIAGILARENAMRNPRRTAATASALMIGLALVTMFSVLGQSAKASVTQSIGSSFCGNYVVKTTGANFGDFSPTVEPQARRRSGRRGDVRPSGPAKPGLRLLECDPHRGRRGHHRPAAPHRRQERQPVVARPRRDHGRAEHGQLQGIEGRLAGPAASSPRPATKR